MKRIIALVLTGLLLLLPLTAMATESEAPSESPAPTEQAGETPSASPSEEPSPSPSGEPSASPSAEPSIEPSTGPSASPGEEPDEPAQQLEIDTEYIYAGMEKSYKNGYLPTVANGKAILVLPLLGDTEGQIIRVTPEISTDGPFVYGNYQFDLRKSTEVAKDELGAEVSREVFLISLELTLSASRYNGTYPVSFLVEYVDEAGEAAQQTFTLQLTITDGRTVSSGGGGGVSAVKKPVILVQNSALSKQEVTGNDSFTLSCSLVNTGDREAKNIRVTVETSGEDLFRTDGLNAVFFEKLAIDETAEVSFALGTSRTILSGRHPITILVSYEDAYGGSYQESSFVVVSASQPPSIGFDQVKFPDRATSGDTITQVIGVYNTGFSTLYNVRCSLSMDGAITASAYFGTLEPQQSADKTMSIFITMLSDGSYGLSSGIIEIYYEDENGEANAEYQNVSLEITAPIVITDEEQAKLEEEAREQRTLSQWWISLLVAIAAILVLVAGIVIARFTRMLKMK
ncbi:MAG: hypothetical protein Q4C04_01435 [Clostridia bacterium]|nr:hypothetical protein [Clostridia bacterium]